MRRRHGGLAAAVLAAGAAAALLIPSAGETQAGGGAGPLPVLGAADAEMVLMGSAPQGAAGETWGYRRLPLSVGSVKAGTRTLEFGPPVDPLRPDPQLAFVRHTAATGWQVFETPLDEHGQPYRGPVPNRLSGAHHPEGWRRAGGARHGPARGRPGRGAAPQRRRALPGARHASGHGAPPRREPGAGSRQRGGRGGGGGRRRSHRAVLRTCGPAAGGRRDPLRRAELDPRAGGGARRLRDRLRGRGDRRRVGRQRLGAGPDRPVAGSRHRALPARGGPRWAALGGAQPGLLAVRRPRHARPGASDVGAARRLGPAAHGHARRRVGGRHGHQRRHRARLHAVLRRRPGRGDRRLVRRGGVRRTDRRPAGARRAATAASPGAGPGSARE